MNRLTISAAALAVLAVSGCKNAGPPPAISGTRLYAIDLAGKASLCAVPANLALADGKETPVAMTTGGGGWCGIPVRGASGAYSAGLLAEPAKNGKVYVHTVGDDTRIDYTPKPGAVVADSFSVRLIPGDAVVKVNVTPAPTVGK